MKQIEIDDEVYRYIAAQTKYIGESASDILRRLLKVPGQTEKVPVEIKTEPKGDVFEVLAGMNLNKHKSRVDRFLFILSAMHQVNESGFAAILELKGRNRVYFSVSKEELLQTGSSTNPKQVPDSEYWVITNNNTGKKVSMLKEVALTLGYNEVDASKLATLLSADDAETE